MGRLLLWLKGGTSAMEKQSMYEMTATPGCEAWQAGMFTDCAERGAFDMRRMYRYETDLHHGVQERLDLTDDVSNQKTSHDALHKGIRSLPVLVEPSQSFPQVSNVQSVDLELLNSENKLGCARGVIWAFVFEAALIIAIVIFWKLRFSLR
jgi:hypothetical protein